MLTSVAYYDVESDAWMVSGSNRLYATEEEATKAAELSNKRRQNYYKKILSQGLSYSDIYNNFIYANDIPKSSPLSGMFNTSGSAAGRGFYYLFGENGTWDDVNQIVTFSVMIEMSKTNEDVRSFLLAYAMDCEDYQTRNALYSFLN